jgi:two-component system heavy metal sensor histidine kinase CusS
MSLSPKLPETPATAARTPLLVAAMARLRRSMALQIVLAILGVTVLLIVAGSWMVSQLLAQNFDGLYPPLVYSEGVVSIKAEVLQERREAFAKHAWRIIVITLSAGAVAAGLFAWWITRRILSSAERLAHTANRISAQALHERLVPEYNPTELEAVARAFNEMLDRLQNTFAQLSGFSSDVAHDLRAPIHALLTATQVTLSRPRSAEEYRAVLESAVPVYERMGGLIENILFLARGDQMQATVHMTAITLSERLANTADFFGLLAEERGLRLALHVHGAVQVWADDTLFTRAVANLLTNAIRHARDGSTVTLSAAASPDGGCHISVANEGEPIAPEHQARIFDRNYRVEGPGTEGPTGSGLGLAIVKSTMDLHGGTVSVCSTQGQPTVFTLHFPPPGSRRH